MPSASSPSGSATRQSRPRAALLCLRAAFFVGSALLPLAIAGCASGGASPMAALFSDALSEEKGLADRAAGIPYASLRLDAGDRQGLVVLAAQANGETYWPTGNQGLVTLRHEGLHTTVGLAQNLLDTAFPALPDTQAPWRQQDPTTFRLIRTWQDPAGLPRRMAATGRLACGEPEAHALPLATLTLEPCEMTLQWANGEATAGKLWRDPQSLRLWAGEEQAWPDGPTLEWEVARQWW
ncbi:YjbF family lipoprotein [Halomonas halodenitrificans]|uniref:YjbF family lipoprotein n=1 Tax=Halomonas halodenitrificans TaxID=28252 RepID=UPI0009FC03A2|nr:YjbF family lipoprotein [Halomonas halodenitrificans]